MKEVKNTVPRTYVINGKEIIGTFMKKNCEKQIKENLIMQQKQI